MRTLLFLLLTTFSVATATAQNSKQEDIDVNYGLCVIKDTACPNVSDCAFRAYAAWEKQMQEEYERLLHELKKEDDKLALKQAQAAWLAYRDATFTSYDFMFDIPGNKWCRQRHEDRVGLVRDRTLQLRNYYLLLRKK